MTSDAVESQRRALLIGINYLSERNQAKLYESLESVADAADEAVTILKEIRNAFFDGGCSEESSDEFGGTLRE